MTQTKVLLVDFINTLFIPNSSNSEYILNIKLLHYLASIKTKFRVYLFTSGTAHTQPEISTSIRPYFDGFITSTELKMPKSFPDIYKVIANKLSVKPEEIIFIDDQQKNIIAANQVGVTTIQFMNTQQIITELTKKLSENQ